MATKAETEVKELFVQWEQAVRNEDFAGIRAHHSEDFLMFDVPPPFLSRGLDAYMETWKLFYSSQARPITFYFEQLDVKASDDVAFASGIGTCRYIEHDKEASLKFRLTMGFQKRAGNWLIVHEHHSVPAES
jgi:ketosteroid isomerase-like protein